MAPALTRAEDSERSPAEMIQRTVEKMKNLAYSKVPSCMVYVSLGSINDDDWAKYLDFAKTTMSTLKPPRSLVVTEGVPPTPAQRQKLNEIVKPFVGVARTSVVTSSTVSRGVLTALGWFTPDVYKVFSPEDLDSALAYLDLPRLDAVQVKGMLPAMIKEAANG